MHAEYALSTTKVTMSTRIFFPVLRPPREPPLRQALLLPLWISR
jgi:hypothetical protein